jgi:hypothetical protein
VRCAKVLLILLLVIAAFANCPSKAQRFAPGFYAAHSDVDDIFRIEKQADAELIFSGEDPDTIEAHIEGKRKFYSRQQLKPILKALSKKDLMLVRFEKPVFVEPGASKRLLQKIEPFLLASGFGRVFILGSHSTGVIVIKDIEYQKKPRWGRLLESIHH